MDLTPGEKAVLGQIRVLYLNGAKREQQVKSLLMLWPPTHYEAYERAFSGLVAKALISHVGSQFFKINDAGLKAMRIEVPQAPPPAPQVVRQADRRQVLEPRPQPVSKFRQTLARLGVLRARN